MISKECFTAKWIDKKAKELNYPDRNIIEKVVHTFSLLDMLAASGCPFHFKGGSSLMLLLKGRSFRLSIDVDIICPPGINIETYLRSYKDYGFIDYEPIQRAQLGTNIPKSHSRFFYQMAFLDGVNKREPVLLDVLNEDCPYSVILNLPVESTFIKTEGLPNVVKVPSTGDILGDKLTAFAPNTTGIPYFKNGRENGLDIIKQLYDVARLFENVEDLATTIKSFGRIAENELSYRNFRNDIKQVFEDIRQTSLCLATRGTTGVGSFDALQRGINRIKSFMFNGKYLIDDAIKDAACAAYVATLIEAGHTSIEKFDGKLASIDSLEMASTVPDRLKRLRRTSPEAYFYWAKTSQMLQNIYG